MALVIDTSALIAMERGGAAATLWLEPHLDEPIWIPAVVWAELLVGVRMAKSALLAAQRRARLEQLRLYAPILPFDVGTAECYADIFAECSKSGRMIPQNDMAVAATARVLKCGVLVGPEDERHFKQVKGLKVVALGAHQG